MSGASPPLPLLAQLAVTPMAPRSHIFVTSELLSTQTQYLMAPKLLLILLLRGSLFGVPSIRPDETFRATCVFRTHSQFLQAFIVGARSPKP